MQSVQEQNAANLAKVIGLRLISDFVSPEEEADLMDQVDSQGGENWLGDLKRRVQHYGFKYDYKARRIDTSMQLGDLPVWLQRLAGRLVTEGVFTAAPDQVIINEYQPGQGISPHVDCVPCFNDTIASLSLGGSCVMEFSKEGVEKVPLFLAARSLVVLTGEARYDWRHSIPARSTDAFAGESFPRGRRVSLTFRRVILTP